MTRYERNREDLRVMRTRKLILDALIDLTLQKGFSAVTVRDITNQAKVNRATFYRHYQDKFDLVNQYVREVYHLADDPSATNSASSGIVSSGEPPVGLVRLFDHIRANAKFFRVMLGQNGDPGFAERIRQFIQKRLRSWLPEALLRDETTVELYLSYVSGGSLTLILWWLEHDTPYTPAEIAAIAQRLGYAGRNVALGQPK